MSPLWRGKLIATGVHFVATAVVASLAAALIFLVWFPDALADMVGGAQLFQIVVACDMALGPLLSLVVYNSNKSRKELVTDYSIIAVVQLAALVYGVWSVAVSRPAFVLFYADRLEIVTAIELDDAELSQGIAPEFRSRSWTGPRLASVETPEDAKQRTDLIFSAIAGKDGQFFPKYYREYASALPQIQRHARSIDDLLRDSGTAREQFEAAIESTGQDPSSLRWLLVHHRFGFGTALIDAESGEPLEYIPVDPSAG